MTSDAALDLLAFLVGLRLIGPDERRRLRIALAQDPRMTGHPGFDMDTALGEEALLSGQRPPETLQDHLDLARAERERAEPPFPPAFWAARIADLVRARFHPDHAEEIVAEVRARVSSETAIQGDDHARQHEKA